MCLCLQLDYGWFSNNETWYTDVATAMIVHRNSLRQSILVNNDVCAYNLLIVGLPTMKLGTLIFHDKSSSKQKLQGCKQQQTHLRQ